MRLERTILIVNFWKTKVDTMQSTIEKQNTSEPGSTRKLGFLFWPESINYTKCYENNFKI